MGTYLNYKTELATRSMVAPDYNKKFFIEKWNFQRVDFASFDGIDLNWTGNRFWVLYFFFTEMNSYRSKWRRSMSYNMLINANNYNI